MAGAMATTAIQPMSRAQWQAQTQDLKAQLRQAKQTGAELITEGRRRMSVFVREKLPELAMYAGVGAALGGLLGYWLHDQAKAYFGADSYLGLYGTAALGGLAVYFTPQIVKVTAASFERAAATQAGAYGFSIGLLAAGAYRAYQDASK